MVTVQATALKKIAVDTAKYTQKRMIKALLWDDSDIVVASGVIIPRWHTSHVIQIAFCDDLKTVHYKI